ncbi:AraC family transcriptional regulator [Affinibrenneria salicis]|uniref:AraC family transcriptional regulator n=1 Tax=Affinibrenneria salicis TaxID=2590031 RepID=A0A5J5FXY8_9GAMM|nr:AraC family transcriptional regulator [Affinibrenneria salicis]KAA8998603.1 AraC family transcriptional regulator [Affinibrenneria salicis]
MNEDVKDCKILLNGKTAISPSHSVKRPAPPEDIRLWRDRDIGHDTELLRAVFYSHRYPAHSHDEFVIAAFERGAQRHSISRKTGVAVPGTVMIIPPGEVHTGEAERNIGMWAYRAFYPAAGVLERVAEELFDTHVTGLDFGCRHLRKDAALARHLTRAHQVIETARDPLEKQTALIDAMAALIDRYGQLTKSGRIKAQPGADVRRALELIHACFDQRLTIDQVADAAGLSEYHFMRSFHKKTGMTVHAYINQTRLRAAKEHLANGMTATQTAVSVGFCDQSHLTHCFRASFGVTPGQYAQACR